jgi:hypothetical protein
LDNKDEEDEEKEEVDVEHVAGLAVVRAVELDEVRLVELDEEGEAIVTSLIPSLTIYVLILTQYKPRETGINRTHKRGIKIYVVKYKLK